MVIRLYLLIRLRRETQTDLDSLLDKFAHVLANDFTKQSSETFRLVSTSIEDYWIRLRFESLIKESAVSTIHQRFQQIRLAVLHVQESLGFPEPIDSISAVGTAARLYWTEQDPSGNEIPWWVPEEFRNSLLIDQSVLELLPLQIGERFKSLQLRDTPVIFQYKINDDVIQLSQQASIKNLFAHFRNLPVNDTGSDIPAVKLVVPCKDMNELLRLAHQAYKDVPESKGVGGRSLLISFCLERNSVTPQGNAVIPNASALGLTYTRETDFIKQIISGNLILKSAVGRSST